MEAPDVWEEYYDDDAPSDLNGDEDSVPSVSGSYFSSLINSENNNFNDILFDYPNLPGPAGRRVAKGGAKVKSSANANHDNNFNYGNNDSSSYSNKNYTNYNSSSNYNEHNNKEQRRQQRGAQNMQAAADGSPTAAKREIDRLSSTVREQRTLIEKLFEDNRGLLGVVRYQGKQLSEQKRSKDPHSIFTAEGQMGVLLERVRRLNEKNETTVKRLKAEEEKNRRLAKELIELKSNPNRDMFMDIFEDSVASNGVVSTLGSEPHLNTEQKGGRQGAAHRAAAMTAGTSPGGDDTSPLVQLLQRNLKSQKIISSKEITQLQQEVASLRGERDGLQEEVGARERECRVHVLKIKQLRQICANLEEGNKKLAAASGAFAHEAATLVRRPQPPTPRSPIVAKNSRLRNAKGARAKALSVAEADYESSSASAGGAETPSYMEQASSFDNSSSLMS